MSATAIAILVRWQPQHLLWGLMRLPLAVIRPPQRVGSDHGLLFQKFLGSGDEAAFSSSRVWIIKPGSESSNPDHKPMRLSATAPWFSIIKNAARLPDAHLTGLSIARVLVGVLHRGHSGQAGLWTGRLTHTGQYSTWQSGGLLASITSR